MTKMHMVFMTPYHKKNTAIHGVPLLSLLPTKHPQNMMVTKIARLPWKKIKNPLLRHTIPWFIPLNAVQ